MKKRKMKKARSLICMDMILRGKGGPMKDSRNKRKKNPYKNMVMDN